MADQKNRPFPDWLTAGLEAARLAPSGHNTQPWRFTWNSNELTVGWEAERDLTAGDPGGRYLLTSLGAAVESFALAAAERGVEARFHARFDRELRMAGVLEAVQRRGRSACGELAAMIPRRKTTRLPFEPARPGSVHLGGLQRVADCGGLQLRFTADPGHIRSLAETVAAGTERNLSAASVATEFCRWLRFPGDQRPDGLSATALEYNALETLAARVLLRPRALRAGHYTGLNRRMAATQARLALATPIFGLLTAAASDPAALIQAGRIMQRVWLEATRHGLRVHPMTAGIDYPDLTTTTLAIFGADQRELPVLCFRVGYGPSGNWARKRPISFNVE